MGNILDFGNSISFFISLSSVIGGGLIILFIVTYIDRYFSGKQPSENDIMKITLNGSYLVILIIGIFLLSTKDYDSGYLTFVYTIFGIAYFFAIFLRVIISLKEEKDMVNEIVNVFLPGFMIHSWKGNSAVFFIFLVLCIIIMSFALISSKLEEVFSFKNFLGAYCLFQGLNYIYINSSYSNAGNTEITNVEATGNR